MCVLISIGPWKLYTETIGQREKWEHKANLIDTIPWRLFNGSLNQRQSEIEVKCCVLGETDKFPKLCIIMS